MRATQNETLVETCKLSVVKGKKNGVNAVLAKARAHKPQVVVVFLQTDDGVMTLYSGFPSTTWLVGALTRAAAHIQEE